MAQNDKAEMHHTWHPNTTQYTAPFAHPRFLTFSWEAWQEMRIHLFQHMQNYQHAIETGQWQVAMASWQEMQSIGLRMQMELLTWACSGMSRQGK